MANKSNSGALFRAKPTDNANRPGYSGTAQIAGVEYWVSAWIKESETVGKYFSLAFKPKEPVSAPAPKPTDDDSIPF